MKANKILVLASTALLLSACGTKGTSSSFNSVSSSDVTTSESSLSIDSSSNSGSSEVGEYKVGLGGLPQIDDGLRHDAGGFTENMFKQMLEDTYYDKCYVKKFNYARDVYLRSSSLEAKHEILQTSYEFKTDATMGTVLTGKASVEAGKGVLETKPIEGSGYTYNIQSYATGGYLHYIEKVNVLEGTSPSRISYDSISKNNRYSNMWTHYSANPDLVLIESAYDLLIGYYDAGAEELCRYIDTSTGEAIFKVEIEEYVAYTDYNYRYFMYAHADKNTKKLTRLDYGWMLYDPDGNPKNDKNIQTIRVESIYGFDYGAKSKFEDKLLTEKDVDKVYGGPAQHPVDYSSWADGALSEENSIEILSNLQTFAGNTASTKGTFNIDRFIDPNNSVDDDGEFVIQGALRGTFESKKYKNDFVETKASAILSTEEGATIAEFDSTIQAEANDDGMYVVESYGTSKLKSHKHTWAYNEIDDVDPYVGVNPIYRSEIFHPFQIAATYGTNNPGQGDDAEEIPTNYYITEGTMVKNGNTIAATFTKIYHKNIWTPYWTYTTSFKIEDGFLSETSISVSSYYETDSSQYTIKSSFSFVNTRGTDYGEFKGEKLNPENFEEATLMAKNESLYK